MHVETLRYVSGLNNHVPDLALDLGLDLDHEHCL